MSENAVDYFHFEKSRPSFEDLGRQNGFRYWFARDLMAMLGYYALFQNKGYLGLYNMSISQLRERKGIPDGKNLLDFMEKEELAANLFRITQTEAKIRNEGLRGQKMLEDAAYSVGRQVRKAMEEISGTRPENLPVECLIHTREKSCN